jgi:glycosyltransferase involved in cell wall biosynthesis
MFPNAVLEAMAAGVPVIAARAGAVPEIVPDGEAGILASPGDGAAFLSAIESLLVDPERARRLGAAGRRRFEQFYDIRVVAPRILAVVREAIERHRPA